MFDTVFISVTKIMIFILDAFVLPLHEHIHKILKRL